MNNRCFRYAIVILLVACSPYCSGAAAQDQPAPAPGPGDNSASFGAGLTMKYPYESFGDDFNTGYGLQAIMDYPFIPLLDVTAGIGWNHFPEGDAQEALDIWEFTAGARLRLGVFFMSGEVGYYTKVDDTSFLPGMGLRFTHLELAFNIRAVPSGSWTGLRLGYYF
jgi:hypothetical protein